MMLCRVLLLWRGLWPHCNMQKANSSIAPTNAGRLRAVALLATAPDKLDLPDEVRSLIALGVGWSL